MSTDTGLPRRSLRRFRTTFAVTIVVLVVAVLGLGTWSVAVVRGERPGSIDGSSAIVILQRHADADDELIVRDLGTGIDHSVFTAPTIQEYAAGLTALAIVTQDAAGAPTMQLLRLSDGAVRSVELPGAGVVTQVHASAADAFGFVFTSATVMAGTDLDGSASESALFMVDTDSFVAVGTVGSDAADDSATLRAVAVPEVAGAPLLIADWLFVPGSSSFVAQSYDQQLFLFNRTQAQTEEPSPLGTFYQIVGFVPGTLDLIVTDSVEGSAIDLGSGDVTVLTLPDSSLDLSAIPGQILVVGALDSYAQVFTELTDSGSYADTVLYTSAAGSTTLLRTDGDERVGAMCASRDGSRLAVMVATARSGLDGLPGLSLYKQARTVIVDIASGQEVASLDGQLASWCRS